MIGHKPLCVFELDPKEGECHRIPIDCVTIQELWNSKDRLSATIKEQDAKLQELKALLYDLEHSERD